MVGKKVNVAGNAVHARKPGSAYDATPALTPEERYRRIAQAAYLRAAARGFLGGDPVQDWLEAEKDFEASVDDKTVRGR